MRKQRERKKEPTHFRGEREVKGALDSLKTCAECKRSLSILKYNVSMTDYYGRAYTKKICVDCDGHHRKIISNIKKEYAGTKPDKCMLCEIKTDELEVDHCHETGAMRGWICRNCNTGLGKFFDKSDLLIKAIEYLKKEPMKKPPKKQLDLFEDEVD